MMVTSILFSNDVSIPGKASGMTCTDSKVTPVSIKVSVTNSVSVEQPDVVLFHVVNTTTNTSCCVFLEFGGTETIPQSELFSLSVNVFGLRKAAEGSNGWYTVLSFSDGDMNQYIDPCKGTLPCQINIPPLTASLKDISFVSEELNSLKVAQTDSKQMQYTCTWSSGDGGIVFLRRMSDSAVRIHKTSNTSITFPYPLKFGRKYDIHILKITHKTGNTYWTKWPLEHGKFAPGEEQMEKITPDMQLKYEGSENTSSPKTTTALQANGVLIKNNTLKRKDSVAQPQKMTKLEVEELCDKALRYVSYQPMYSVIPYLYRNKSWMYFDDIMLNKNGYMNAYIKNEGGDPASSLNGQINGLFFSAVIQTDTGLPPRCSPFGSARLHIPTLALFDDDTNLYFSDFYCHSKRHKVQLVLAVQGRKSDVFCQQRLVNLNPFNNPFFFKAYDHEYGRFVVYVAQNVIVEVFVTEGINIRKLKQLYPFHVFFSNTLTIGSGLNTKKGLPKDPACRICNLSRVFS